MPKLLNGLVAIVVFIITVTADLYSGVITVEGQIVDSESGNPVDNAVIRIPSAKKTIITDADGFFTIDSISPGEYHVNFSRLGYKSFQKHCIISADSLCGMAIKMTPMGVSFPTVVVSGKKGELKFVEVSGNKTDLSGRKLQKVMGQSLASTLKNEAGVSVRSLGPAPSRPVIRGLGGSRVVIAEDGVQSTDLSATSPDHAVTVDPFTLDEISIMRGPEAVQYSTSLAGGVVNATRNEIPMDIPEKILLGLGGFYESANQGKLLAASIEGPYNKFAYNTDISYRNTADMTSPDKKLDNTSIRTLNYNAGIGFEGDGWVIGAGFREFDSEYGIPGGFVGSHPNGVDIKMLKRAAGIKGIYHFHGSFIDNLKFSAERSYYKHTEYESDSTIGAEFVIRDYIANISLHQRKGNIFENGSMGLFFNYKDHKMGGYVFTPPTEAFTAAAFIFEEYKFGDNFIQSGLRYSFDTYIPNKNSLITEKESLEQRDFHSFAFSISAARELFDDYFFGINLSRSVRPPSIEELFNKGPHLAAYSYERGNPDLDGENGMSYEIFTGYRTDKFSLNLNAFYNHFDYYIIPRNTGDTNYSVLLPIYMSEGVEAEFMGFELEGSLSVGGFDISADAAYTRGEIVDENSPLPMIPPFKSNLEMEYNISRMKFGVRFEYAAQQDRVDRFEEKTDSYFLTGLFGQYTFTSGGFIHNVSLNIDNLFNREYRNHLSRIKSIMPEPGFNIRFVYRALVEL